MQHELQHESLYGKILRIILTETSSTKELSIALGQKTISGQLKKVLAILLNDKLAEWTKPDIATSSKQKYQITERGTAFLQLLDKK